MKIVALILTIILFFFTIEAELLDKIIAKAGKEIILESELETRIQQMEAAGLLPDDFSKLDLLNDMIESRIIVLQAKEEGYTVDELSIREMAEKQINQISEQFETEEQFIKQLKLETGLTPIELKEFYIDMIRENDLREQVIREKIKNRVHVTEAEIENYYQDNRENIPRREKMDKIGMIMRIIKPSKETKDEALIEINKIMDKIKTGADFDEILQNLDKNNADITGGDLGFFGRGKYIKAFEDAAFSLRMGEISDIVETSFGYHIIKIEEKKEDEIRASHILRKIVPTELDVRANYKLMENVLDRLRQGEDFEEIASKYSEDDETALNGGVIGEFLPGKYPEKYKDYFSNLDYGQYSDLIRDGDNLYIFAKLSTVPEREYTYEEIYEKLKNLVTSEKETELYEDLIKNLMKENYVETFLEE